MKTHAHKIEFASFEDAPAIFSLIKLYPDVLLPRPLSDIVQNIDRFLVCKVDSLLVGCVSWQILPEIGTPSKPSVEIKSLAVKDQYRKQGIGKALVTAAIEHIRVVHPAQIVALTFVPDFFEELGFKEIPKERLMHKLYAGCINCTRYDSPFSCPERSMLLDVND